MRMKYDSISIVSDGMIYTSKFQVQAILIYVLEYSEVVLLVLLMV
jgi:hypothetical protein